MSKKNSDQASNQELVDVSNQVSKTSPSQLMSVISSTPESESNMPPPLSTDLNPGIVLIQDLENKVDDMDTAETAEGKKETVGNKNNVTKRGRKTNPDTATAGKNVTRTRSASLKKSDTETRPQTQRKLSVTQEIQLFAAAQQISIQLGQL